MRLLRSILGAIGIFVTVGGVAALTPLLAVIGGGVTLTAITLGLAIWRWFRRRGTRAAAQHLG